MKKIKTKDIEPNKLITKARYAKKIGLTQPAIQRQIDSGKLTVVIADGAELIHL